MRRGLARRGADADVLRRDAHHPARRRAESRQRREEAREGAVAVDKHLAGFGQMVVGFTSSNGALASYCQTTSYIGDILAARDRGRADRDSIISGRPTRKIVVSHLPDPDYFG